MRIFWLLVLATLVPGAARAGIVTYDFTAVKRDQVTPQLPSLGNDLTGSISYDPDAVAVSNGFYNIFRAIQTFSVSDGTIQLVFTPGSTDQIVFYHDKLPSDVGFFDYVEFYAYRPSLSGPDIGALVPGAIDLSFAANDAGVFSGPDLPSDLLTGPFTTISVFIDYFDLSGDYPVPVREFYEVTGVRAAGAVPEPTSWALAIAGFAMVGGAARRRAFLTTRNKAPEPKLRSLAD